MPAASDGPFEVGAGLGQLGGRNCRVPDLGHECNRVVAEVVADELADLRLLGQRLRAHVDEQRPGQRVGAIGDGCVGGDDAAGAAIDGGDAQALLVLGVVGVAEVAGAAPRAGDAGDEHVVVGGVGVVGTGGAALAVHFLGEEVEGAGVGVGAEELDLLVGPAGAHLVPARDGVLGVGTPEDAELLHGDALEEVGVGMGDDGEAVEGDAEGDVLDAGFGAGVDFLLLDGA